MNQPKPYPFCGSFDVTLEIKNLLSPEHRHLQKHSDDKGLTYSVCRRCGASGPITYLKINSGESGSDQMRSALGKWNHRESKYPVIVDQNRFIGFLMPSALSRPPKYDGERFYIMPPFDPLLAPVEKMDDTVEVISASWSWKKVRSEGRVYKGWFVDASGVDEKLFFRLPRETFMS